MAARKPIAIHEKEHVSWCELRPHGDGTFDELIVNGAGSLHTEQMDSGLWWMAIYKDGQRQVVWFETDAPIHAWTERYQ
jgi:hypothetical protein